MKQTWQNKKFSTAFFSFPACAGLPYFTAYIGRLNYSSAMSDMIQTGILTQSHAGFISMLYFFLLRLWSAPQRHSRRLAAASENDLYRSFSSCGYEFSHASDFSLSFHGRSLGNQRLRSGYDLASHHPYLLGNAG